MWETGTAAEFDTRAGSRKKAVVYANGRRDRALAVVASAPEVGVLNEGAIVEAAGRQWRSHLRRPMRPDALLRNLCRQALGDVGETVWDEASPRRPGLALLYVDHHQAHWMRVGDNRLYLFRRGEVDSRGTGRGATRLIDDANDAARSHVRHRSGDTPIREGVGGPQAPSASLVHAEVEPGDAFLLCTDGLWTALDTDEMGALVDTLPAPVAADRLVSLAAERADGGADNLSAAVLRIDPPDLGASAVRGPLCETPHGLAVRSDESHGDLIAA